VGLRRERTPVTDDETANTRFGSMNTRDDRGGPGGAGEIQLILFLRPSFSFRFVVPPLHKFAYRTLPVNEENP